MQSERAEIDPLVKIRDFAEQSQRASASIRSLVTGMLTVQSRSEGITIVAGSPNLTMSLDFLMNFAEAAPLIAIEIIQGVDDPLIIKATRTIEKMFDYRPGELNGKPLTILVPVAKRADHRKWMLEFVKNPVDRQMGDAVGFKPEGLTRTGRVFPIVVTWGQFFVDGNHCMAGCVMPQIVRAEQNVVSAAD